MTIRRSHFLMRASGESGQVFAMTGKKWPGRMTVVSLGGPRIWGF